MDERKHRVSKMRMHHYTYLRDSFNNKISNNVACSDAVINSNMKLIRDRLLKWKEGMPALVFVNDLQNGGNVILSEVELKTKNKK